MWRFCSLDKPAMRMILNQTKGSFKYDDILRELAEAWPDKELKDYDAAKRRSQKLVGKQYASSAEDDWSMAESQFDVQSVASYDWQSNSYPMSEACESEHDFQPVMAKMKRA